MKRFLLSCLLLTAVGFYSFRTMSAKYSDILAALGISPSLAKDNLFNTMIWGQFYPPRSAKFKTYPAGQRAEAVQQLGAFAKNYLMSAEFQKRYMDNYEQSKPRPPKTVQERIDDHLRSYKQNLKQSEEGLKKAEEKYKPMYQQAIETNKKWIKVYEDPNDPQHNTYISYIKTGYEVETKNYKDRLEQLEKKYPKDIKIFIKQRLQEFLEISADVDYEAKTVLRGDLKKFVNPAYERKPAAWKYCYRAGKETVDAARAFAKQWLQELN
ncbi:MAG TPA: hypothetical protein VD996_13625 [Chitinophagaceae bacterium]|nr:hypothetical protein [Chitinophagaceae bacterium]